VGSARISDFEVLADGDPVRAWRGRCSICSTGSPAALRLTQIDVDDTCRNRRRSPWSCTSCRRGSGWRHVFRAADPAAIDWAALMRGPRLDLWQRVFSRFFRWVIARGLFLLLVSGYAMVFGVYCRVSRRRLAYPFDARPPDPDECAVLPPFIAPWRRFSGGAGAGRIEPKRRVSSTRSAGS